jgi:hypothetical protein
MFNAFEALNMSCTQAVNKACPRIEMSAGLLLVSETKTQRDDSYQKDSFGHLLAKEFVQNRKQWIAPYRMNGASFGFPWQCSSFVLRSANILIF